MEHTGTFNPGSALIFLILVLLPTAFHIMKAMISLFEKPESQPLYYEEDTPSSVNIAKINVYNNNSVVKKHSKMKNKTLEKEFGIRRTKQENKRETDAKVIESAKEALVSLGFKKRQASEMIKKLCINKCYTKESELIRDCFK
jgi:Na+-transporting methylmalonyl-CoA/oxaloacetate decarboxylase gamma subunit